MEAEGGTDGTGGSKGWIFICGHPLENDRTCVQVSSSVCFCHRSERICPVVVVLLSLLLLPVGKDQRLDGVQAQGSVA